MELWNLCSCKLQGRSSSLVFSKKGKPLSNKPLFISIDGLDACGKSSLVSSLVQYFDSQDIPAKIVSMFPQSYVREALLSNKPVSKEYELLLTKALHEEAYSLIDTELRSGNFVICDRGPDTIYAYQGYGTGLLEEIKAIEKVCPVRFIPDITFFIDAAPALCQERMNKRGEKKDSFEERDEGFHHRVYEGYKTLIREDIARVESGEQRYPRWHVLDGYLSEQKVALEARLQLDFLLES